MDSQEYKESERVVMGYSFLNEEDAALAEAERKKTEYLRAHLNTKNPDTVLALYNKVLHEHFFKTPIGVEFMRELRDYLIEQADFPEEDVAPIPLRLSYATPVRENPSQTRMRVQSPPEKKKKVKLSPLFVSIVLNIALVVAVIAMFWIATHTDQPNILNYKDALVNQYASWDQELTQREQAVREKERELGVEVPVY